MTTPTAGQTFTRGSISGVYVQATAVNNLMRGDALTELGRVSTGIVSFALAALAVAAALVLGPAAAVFAFLGIAAAWIAAAVIAFRDALALPLVEPLLTSLAALGATVGYRLVVADRIMAAQLAEKRARDAEMASAAAIQRAMLPDAQQENFAEGRLDVFAQMIPAKEVGGDLYDIVKLDENRVVITIGDVCGKGVPASLFMAISQTVMRLSVRSSENLQGEIGAANNLLVANNRETMFTTLFCGVLDVTTGTMTYCNCGHNPPLVLRRGESTFEQLRNCGPALAIIDDFSYSPRSITLAPGDMLFLYTDGVSEAEDQQQHMFEMPRLEQALLEARDQPARGVVEHVVKRVTEFAKGAPQSDDITCIAGGSRRRLIRPRRFVGARSASAPSGSLDHLARIDRRVVDGVRSSKHLVGDQAFSCRAMNSLATSRALSVCGPGSATHSCTEFSNSRYSQVPPAAW